MGDLSKTIICLANSRMLSGRCVAGIELAGNQPAGWIRPVSAHPDEGLSTNERRYENGSEPQLLDIIEIALIKPVPHLQQTENWLTDSSVRWKKVGSFDPALLPSLKFNEASLWDNGSSTRDGMRDQVPESMLSSIDHSLLLIPVSSMAVKVLTQTSTYRPPKRRVQRRFIYKETTYRLWVTDHRIEEEYLAKENGSYRMEPSFLTISLGRPFENGYSQKLIAGVIELSVTHG